MELRRNPSRSVRIGSISIGAGHPIAVQSMTATHTQNVAATVARSTIWPPPAPTWCGWRSIATKTPKPWPRFAAQTKANLAVDLQENYRLASQVAPHVDKLRYNPGHLYHHERQKPWQDKVKFLVDIAGEHDCAIADRRQLRIGRSGKTRQVSADADSLAPMVASAWSTANCSISCRFTRYCVSLKDSDPAKVIEVNRRFADERPDVPLHLGVTEAGLPPEGIIKTRVAFEQLISRGIGDTIRVSLTVPNARKSEEIVAGRQILADIAAGRVRSVVDYGLETLNIISCPSCSRVENEAFIELAAAGQRDDPLRPRARPDDRRDGLPRERAGRNRRCRPRPVVRTEAGEFEARQPGVGGVSLRCRFCLASRKN